jgi:SAM-dependent methyltransferase
MKRDFGLVQRLDVVRELCAGKSVLHLGCTNYPYTEESIRDAMLLHDDLAAVASDLWGLDSDERGIEMLTARGSTQMVRGDLEALEAVDLERSFDIIVAGEMIEHLNNPGLFLNGIRRFMAPDSRLIVTTVNAYCGMRFLWYGLRGKGGKSEFVHPDHVAYYSYHTLKVLLERHELEMESFWFYDLGREHRKHSPWYVNAVNDVCVTIAPQWADGVIALCRLETKQSDAASR